MVIFQKLFNHMMAGTYNVFLYIPKDFTVL